MSATAAAAALAAAEATPVPPAQQIRDSKRSSAKKAASAVWSEHFDARTGAPFFHNTVTGRSVWKLPEDHWHKARDLQTNRIYFFNLLRQQSTYAEPEEYEDEDFSRCAVLPYSGAALGHAHERKNFAGFVPAMDPDRGAPFWHARIATTWIRPGNAVELPLDSFQPAHEYAELERQARVLQTMIHDATDEIDRLALVSDQIEETADARAKRLHKLRSAGRPRQSTTESGESGRRDTGARSGGGSMYGGSTQLRQKGVTRYLETSFGRVAMRGSVRTMAQPLDSFLKTVPLFHNLNEEQFEVVRRALRKQTFEPNEVIVRQDTKGDLLYLIADGKVRIYVAGAYSEEQTLLPEDSAFGRFVNELIAGDHFGERSLLSNVPRTATAVAATKVVAYTLSREVFLSVVDPADVTQAGHSNLSQMQPEVASFSKHVSNFDVLLSLQRRANTSREARVADALMRLMTSFCPELNVTDTVARMRKTLFHVFNCERVSLFAVDWDEQKLSLEFGEGDASVPVRRGSSGDEEEGDESQEGGGVLAIGEGIPGHCARVRKIVNVPHVHKGEHFFGEVYPMGANGKQVTRNVLCCPVFLEDGTVIAVIELVNKRGGAPFSEEDEHVVASVSEQMSLTLAQRSAEQHNDLSMLQYLPVWRLESAPVAVKVKRLLATSLPGHVVSDSIIVSMTAFYAGQPLAPTRYVTQTAERLTPYMVVVYDQMLELDLTLSNVPRAMRVIFNVYYAPKGLPEEAASPTDGSSAAASSGSVSSPTGAAAAAAGSSRRGARDRRRVRKETKEGNAFDAEAAVLEGSATAIGWAGLTLFDFDQVLRTGHLRLRLFKGEASADVAAVAPILNNNTRAKDAVDFLELELPAHEKPVVYSDFVSDEVRDAEKAAAKATQPPAARSNLYRQMRRELDSFIHADPLRELSREEKMLIMQFRRELSADPAALPKFCQAVDWAQRSQTQMAYAMLNRWAMPDPVVALQLLDFKHPDPKVRALAVSALEPLDDRDLELYMLQLVQVLKFERFADSALSRFLLRRALRAPAVIGHRLFWLLKAEMHVPEVADRYGALLDVYLRHCRTRADLGHQQFVVNRLDALADAVKAEKQTKRTALLQTQLRGTLLPGEFQLPLSPDLRFKGFDAARSHVKNSKKAPLLLECVSARAGAPPVAVLYKSGDDLRQDQLTLQVLRVMNRLWQSEGMDMRMSLYGVVSTGDQRGFIQIVPNADTIARITAGKRGGKLTRAVKVFDDKKLKRHLANSGYSRRVTETNFCFSCAAYCVATYVLGVGDRHNDNLMLTRDGKLLHIDFGHFLGNFKSKLGVKRERAPFIFTPAMANVLGKQDKPLFQLFEEVCGRAYNVLRRNANLLITLFSLMLSCGIPELQRESDIDWLREKLMLDASDEEAAAKFKQLIQESLSTWSVQLNDFAHIIRRN